MLKPLLAAINLPLSAPNGLRLRSWIHNALNFSHPWPSSAENARSYPTVAAENANEQTDKPTRKGLFTRFPFATTANTRNSSDGSEDSFATAPRSPVITANRHSSATYSQVVGQPCYSCGGTGIEAPPYLAWDMEKGNRAKAEVGEVHVKEVHSERKMTIHDVRRWGRENLGDSGIWGHGRVNI